MMSKATSNQDDKNSASQFELRAPPRKRVKGETIDDQPLFLRKAYAMITSCPTEIGGWSDDGETVVIKDIKNFSEKIIPTAYKHNNFSSFVRQLNFYGFRKVKSESLNHSNWWEFRHPSFVRGKPYLLSDIKRSVHYETPNGQEMNDLKTQVTTLGDRMTKLNEQIAELSGFVSRLQIQEGRSQTGSEYRMDNKRRNEINSKPLSLRRLSTVDGVNMNEVELFSGDDLDPNKLFEFDSLEKVDSFKYYEDEKWELEQREELMDILSSPVEKKADYQRFDSVENVTFKEELTNLLPNASMIISNPHSSVSIQNESNMQTTLEQPTLVPVTDISAILEKLPAELKVRFVDKLAEEISKQIVQQMLATPTTAINCESVQTTRNPTSSSPDRAIVKSEPMANVYHLPSGEKAPEIAIPLASAALSAFFMTYNGVRVNDTLSSIKQEII